MAATIIPCYPFAHIFEEEVVKKLSAELKPGIAISHNVLRPNIRNKGIPKEIDIAVISTMPIIMLGEIKGYHRPPKIDDIKMYSADRQHPNPVVEMKEYGQRLRSEMGRNKFNYYTIPCAIFKNKDSETISSKWRHLCFNLDEFIVWVKNKIKNFETYVKNGRKQYDPRDIVERFLCAGIEDRFDGFTAQTFDLLRDSDKYYERMEDIEYNQEIYNSIYYKFRCFGYDTRSYLSNKNIVLHQHIQGIHGVSPLPIRFIAFTLMDTPNFLTEPQFSFHLSTKDWYHSDMPNRDHFAVKLAFFHNSRWMRELLKEFRRDSVKFMALLNGFDKKYYCISSITAHDNLFSVPICDLKYDQINSLAIRVLDEHKSVRHIGFEKPVYEEYLRKPGNRNNLIKYVADEFVKLIKLLDVLLPDYKHALKKFSEN